MTDHFDKWINGMSDDQYEDWLEDDATEAQEEKALNIRTPISEREEEDLDEMQRGEEAPTLPTPSSIVVTPIGVIRARIIEQATVIPREEFTGTSGAPIIITNPDYVTTGAPVIRPTIQPTIRPTIQPTIRPAPQKQSVFTRFRQALSGFFRRKK